jgi:hypothetical protein
MLIMMPFTIISVITGYITLLKHIHIKSENNFNNKNNTKLDFIKQSSPVWIIILIFIILTILFKMFNINIKGLETFFAMLSGLIYTILFTKPNIKIIYKSVISKKMFNILLIILAVIIFKQTIDYTGTVNLLISDFNKYNINPIYIIIILPFITGILTGLSIGFVGSTFPLIVPLIKITYSSSTAYIMLAFFCGYMGVLLSPVHICFVLTKDFFSTKLISIIKHNIINYTVLIIFCIIWFYILNYFLI